jgi:hypothetical protein
MRCDPRKPAPPVTRTRFLLSYSRAIPPRSKAEDVQAESLAWVAGAKLVRRAAGAARIPIPVAHPRRRQGLLKHRAKRRQKRQASIKV